MGQFFYKQVIAPATEESPEVTMVRSFNVVKVVDTYSMLDESMIVLMDNYHIEDREFKVDTKTKKEGRTEIRKTQVVSQHNLNKEDAKRFRDCTETGRRWDISDGPTTISSEVSDVVFDRPLVPEEDVKEFKEEEAFNIE